MQMAVVTLPSPLRERADPEQRPRVRRLADVLGIGWIVLFALLLLSPALKDGGSFGPTDLGKTLSPFLTPVSSVAVHDVINGDVITLGVPWNTLDWQLVHHGELPLWDAYAGTGLPLFLNFESATFALPTLVGYLAPLNESFLVTVLVKLLIAGSGTYVLLRVLRARPIAAAIAGMTYMLCGSLSGWLGWAISGPFVWTGWIAAAALLAYRGRWRVRAVALFAVAVAFSIYAGFPESNALVAAAAFCFLVTTAIIVTIRRRRVDRRGVARVVGGAAAGIALSAPLWLPGLSAIAKSSRNGSLGVVGIEPRGILLAFAQGFDGLPIHGSTYFGPTNYFETAAYVGIVAVVLALTALVALRHHAAVIGLAVTAVACLLVIYRLGRHLDPIQHLINRVGLGSLAAQRTQSILAFVIAVLAGLGWEVIASRWHELSVRRALGASVLGCGAVIALLWAIVAFRPLPDPAQHLRIASLWWPTGTLVLLVIATAVISYWARHRPPWRLRSPERALGLVLLSAQSGFLLFAGVGINSYSPTAFPPTSAVSRLKSVVGDSLVGIDGENTSIRIWAGIGLYPNMNIGYGVDELAIHDPMVPEAYFKSWPVADAGQVSSGPLLFAPDVTSASLARRYGVAYILAAPGVPTPSGTSLVARIDHLGLYSVPDSARFSVISAHNGDAVTSVSQRGDRSWTVHVRAREAGTLELALTDVPGWHVRVDGVAEPVERSRGTLLAAKLPAGARVVRVTYTVPDITVTLGLALLAVIVLISWGLVSWRSARRTVTIGVARLDPYVED
jgi:hypothetical protein